MNFYLSIYFNIYFVGQVNLENVRSEVSTEQIIDM